MTFQSIEQVILTGLAAGAIFGITQLLRSAKRWRPRWLDRIREFLKRPF
jgi:hypothetical protein